MDEILGTHKLTRKKAPADGAARNEPLAVSTPCSACVCGHTAARPAMPGPWRWGSPELWQEPLAELWFWLPIAEAPADDGKVVGVGEDNHPRRQHLEMNGK